MEEEKKYICIVGFAKPHCKYAPWDDPNAEIWSLNEGHVYTDKDDRTMVKEDNLWLKRSDRWFQIHADWDFRRVNHPVPHHLPWLQEQPVDGQPIMMQEAFDDIPASVRYPFEEICDEFCDKLIRRDLSGEERRVLYFTSSLAYMLIYAIYMIEKGEFQPRIELYGTDMEASTEYIHQKGSMEYWIGFANGKGIEVILPKGSMVANAPLYAYEIAQVVPKSTFQKRLEMVEALWDKYNNDRTPITASRDEIENNPNSTSQERADALEEEMKIVGALNKIHGRRAILREIIDNIDNQKPFTDEDVVTEGGIMRSTVEVLKKLTAEAENTINRQRILIKGMRNYCGSLMRDAHEKGHKNKVRHWQQEGVRLLRKDMDYTNKVNELRGQMFELFDLSQYIDYRESDYLEKVSEPKMELE